MLTSKVPIAVIPVNGHCSKSITGSHWWVIGEANGPTSKGKCKFCRTRRKFWNAWPGKRWKDDGLMPFPNEEKL